MMKIGGEHLFIYHDMDEFLNKVREVKNGGRNFKVDMKNYSWKRKAEEMERALYGVRRR
jgi:hypothetical protein